MSTVESKSVSTKFSKSIELRIIVAELTSGKIISGSEIGLYLLKIVEMFLAFRKNRFLRTWRAKSKDPRVQVLQGSFINNFVFIYLLFLFNNYFLLTINTLQLIHALIY